MIWLRRKESIVIGRNCLLTVSSISTDEVRLCVMVRGDLRVCWPELDWQALLELTTVPAAIITVWDLQRGRVCLEIGGPPEITFQRAEEYAEGHDGKIPDFSKDRSIVVDRKKKEYMFVEAK
jgi:sRNA-binding carbon storage regulator CsrA